MLTDAEAASATVAGSLGQWTPPVVAVPDGVTPAFTVSPGGTYGSVQAAVDAAVRRRGTGRVYIAVAPGTYRGTVCVPASAPPITLYGTGGAPGAVVLVEGHSNPQPKAADAVANPCSRKLGSTTYGTSASATVTVFADDFTASNLTVANDYVEGTYTDPNQSAVALYARGDRQAYLDVRLLGNQDTLFLSTASQATVARQYFRSAYVEGDVDFVFGRATAVFDRSEFHFVADRRRDGVIFAPSTMPSNAHGFLVVNSTISGPQGTSGTVSLARAWDESVASLAVYQNGVSPNGQLVVRDSQVGALLAVDRLYQASTVNRPFCSANCTQSANRFFEYHNAGPGAAPQPSSTPGSSRA